MNLSVGLLGDSGYGAFHYHTGGKIVHSVEEALTKDLLIFTGGADVDPSLYGQANLYSGSTISRDFFERRVLYAAIGAHKKILGICRGHQLINVCLGGTLIQDIGKQAGLSHGRSVHDFHNHLGMWTNPTLARIFPAVNSFHHQAVRKVGRGLSVILRALDGIIEGTSSGDGSVVTFQFHPEWMTWENFWWNDEGRTYFRKVMQTGQLIW